MSKAPLLRRLSPIDFAMASHISGETGIHSVVNLPLILDSSDDGR